MSALVDIHGRTVALADTPVAALSLVDGVALADVSGAVHFSSGATGKISAGAVSACAGYQGHDLLLGDETGVVHHMERNGQHVAITAPLKKWIEHVVALPDGGCVAAIGKQAVLYNADHQEIHRWTHDSAVTGLMLDPKGKRLAASHYNGVSLWWLNNPSAARTFLEWKGSHTGVTWSPDGKFIVTMMQEMALHGWRVADRSHMRMAGYPSKTKSIGWSLKGKYLVTSGAPAVVCWPFTSKDGPMGKAPLELPPLSHALSTAVACHPKRDMVAAGYADGLVLMFRLEDQADLTVAEASGAPVTSLAFSADGTVLGFAREDGSAGFIDLP
jgi:WD40 repeat protein